MAATTTEQSGSIIIDNDNKNNNNTNNNNGIKATLSDDDLHGDSNCDNSTFDNDAKDAGAAWKMATPHGQWQRRSYDGDAAWTMATPHGRWRKQI